MVGEHIRTRRDGRWSHAIDCGDETVIHLEGDVGRARVRRSYRPEFVSGAEVVEVVTHRERTFPATEVVARAYSRIADPALAAMFRDSEAFADWCTTGRLSSGPVNLLAPPPARMVNTSAAGPAPVARQAARPAARKASPRRTGRRAGKASRTRPAAKKRATSRPAAGKSRPASKAAKRRPRRKTRRR